MSNKTDTIKNFRGAAKAAGGAHLTMQARMSTAERFVDAMWSSGHKFPGVRSLGLRHLEKYVQAGLDAGKSTRTLQNEMSHLRAILSAAGRADFAQSVEISNRSLGLAGSSRAGTKVAATDAQYQAALESVGRVDQSVAVALKLERELGLRGAEAVRCSASLATWERSLAAGRPVRVITGTKGGRPRDATPANRERALEAVREARAIAKENNGRLFPGSLQEAMTRYRNVMHRYSEIRGHQLRYSYAQDRVMSYLDAGFSRKESLALTSMDLGHGDGRGRYVERVYALR